VSDPAPQIGPSPNARGAGAVVAAFDVDGTLTTRDCVVPFLREINGTLATVAGLARRPRAVVPALARRDRDALKAVAATVVFRGRSWRAVETRGERFADVVARQWLRDDTVAQLRDHRQLGHTVVLVSASFAAYLRPLARHLGADDVIGTELEVDDAGLCTGRLAGGNCRGPAKVERLHRWLDDRAGGRRAVELWAYGDSAGDRELIADADHGRWVGREGER